MTQLGDIFAYELPGENSAVSSSPRTSESYLVYNFHNLMFQDRFFLFCIDSGGSRFGNFVNSVAEVFPNANWLEREVSELHGVSFTGKKHLRNLMLQYGDTTVPFQKSSPSIGYKEVSYDSVSDVLLETPITIQV
jgi:NADH-quinone oxidoreductase subunit C